MQKTSFRLFFFLLISFSLNAQISIPGFDANWCYNRIGDVGQSLGKSCFPASEMVNINGKDYTKLSYYEVPQGGDIKDVLYRSEGSKFYVFPQDSTEEVLIYDFDLVEGDTFYATWGLGITDTLALEVSNVDTIITVDGVERKKVTLSNGIEHGIWLEGVGSLNWLFMYPAYSNSLSGTYQFICHTQGGVLVYPQSANPDDCNIAISIDEYNHKESIKIFPNPSDGNVTVALENTNADLLEVYDVFGRLIYKKLLASNAVQEIAVEKVFDTGLYLITVKSAGKIVATKKFVVD